MSIKEYVEKQIKSGSYKLVDNEKGTSTMWSIFAMIAEENGSILDGFVHCRKCKSLIKYSRKVRHFAYRHKCYANLRSFDDDDDGDDDLQDESLINETDPISATEHSSIHDNENPPNEEEDLLEDSKLLRKNKNYLQHVETQIKNGIYELKSKQGTRRSTVWSLFKMIFMKNGTKIESIVWCPTCEKLLTYHLRTTSNLIKHKCFLKYLQQDEQPLAKRSKREEDNNTKGSNEELIFLSESEDAFADENLTSIVKQPPQTDEEDEEEFVTSESEFVSIIKIENENIVEEDTAWEEGHSLNNNEDPKNCSQFDDLEKNVRNGVYTLMRKENAKSMVWGLFDLIVKEDGTIAEGYVCCRDCKRLLKFTGKSTSNLNRHKCYLLAVKEAEQKKVNESHKKEAINVCSLWLLQDCLPCSTIEGKGFRKMLNFFVKLGAVYGKNVDIVDMLPDATTVAENIRTIAEEKKSVIKPQIEKLSNHISVTVDLWPDYYLNKQLLSATLHFQKNFKLNIQLGIKTTAIKPNAQDVRNKLEKLLNDFGISNMENIVYITDSQSVLKDALSKNSRLVCSNYLFSKVVDTAIERTDELNGVIGDCKNIVQYFKKNHIQMPKSVGCKIKCGSKYALINSIADNWQQVEDVLNELTSQFVTKEQFSILETLVQLCQKFEVIFKKLQGSRSPSLCFVIPSINCIKAFCECNENDDPTISAFKSSILNCLNENWLPNITLWHKAAFFLYPPANKEQSNDLNEIKEFCIQQIMEMEQNVSSHENATKLLTDSTAAPSNSLESADSKKNSFNGDINFFFPTLVRKSLQKVAKSPTEELARYAVDYVMIDENFNVIQWWQQNSTNYPRLSKLAIRILSIPASNPPNQRTVALAGNIVSEKLNNFSTKTVDNILFLNSIQEKNL